MPTSVPSTRPLRWLGHAALTALLVGVPCHSAQADPPSATGAAALRYAPERGQERVLRFALTGETSWDAGRLAALLGQGGDSAPSPAAVPQSFELRGELHTRVLGRSAGGVRLVGRLQRVRQTRGAAVTPSIVALEAPFRLTVSSVGAVQRLELPQGFPKDAERTIRGVVEALYVVVGGGTGATTWTVDEPASEGARSVVYRIHERDDARGVVRLDRRVTKSRQAVAAPLRLTNLRTEVAESSGTVEWSTTGAGLVSLHTRDAENTFVGLDRVMSGRSTLDAEVEPGPIAELPRTETETERALDDDTAVRQQFYDVPEEFEARLAELDVPSLIRRLVAEVPTDQAVIVTLFKYYVRKHPEEVRALAEALDALPLTPENRLVVGFGLAAIASAGHTQAQAILGEAIAGETFRSPIMRDKALGSILSLKRPESFLLPIVWDYRESLPRTGKNAAYFLSEATNIYGTLGDIAHGVPENTRTVVQTLGRHLRSARTLSERYFALVALSNTGDLDRCMPLVEPYFGAPEEGLRDAAFEIFRKVPGEPAFETFARRYAAETSPEVRAAASEVAVSMPDTAARSAWAAAEAIRETDVRILDRQVRILGDALPNRPENSDRLRRLLRQVDDRPVRKTIYRYVGPTSVEVTR